MGLLPTLDIGYLPDFADDFAADTDGRFRATSGDTYVAVVEFETPVRANVLLTYGNESQPGSEHIGDQLLMASNKEMRDALRSRDDVEPSRRTMS